ncbi:MAG: hypothetical protein GX660_26230 [Clostridiaceae bacterium]|nr:hypothetical protein [Clostridiaceae bacterium]
MYNFKDLTTYRRFIRGYFGRSYRWDELTMCINEFFECTGKEASENLLKEIHYIIELNDWEYIKKFNIEAEGIYYEEERNKEMMAKIIDVLSKNLRDKVSPADIPSTYEDSKTGW